MSNIVFCIVLSVVTFFENVSLRKLITSVAGKENCFVLLSFTRNFEFSPSLGALESMCHFTMALPVPSIYIYIL